MWLDNSPLKVRLISFFFYRVAACQGSATHILYGTESLEQIRPLKEGFTYKTLSIIEDSHSLIKAFSWNGGKSVSVPPSSFMYSEHLLSYFTQFKLCFIAADTASFFLIIIEQLNKQMKRVKMRCHHRATGWNHHPPGWWHDRRLILTHNSYNGFQWTFKMEIHFKMFIKFSMCMKVFILL